MSTPKLKLIQFGGLTGRTTMSPPCGKVHMALRYKGLDFEIKNVQSPQEAKKYNPRGRVPALMFGSEIVVDSTDILTAIDQRYPDPPMMPTDPMERVQVKILEDWADEVLYFYGVYNRFGIPENFERLKNLVFSKLPIPLRYIIPPVARSITRKRLNGQGVGLKDQATVHREVDECLQAIVQLLKANPWVVGKQFTRADIAIAACLDQYRLAQLTPILAQQIEGYPEILEWLDRVHQHAPSAAS